jgi:hypothetical protein
VTMKNAIFWHVTPCRSCVNRPFRGNTFLWNVGSHKIYTASHPRKRHSSYSDLNFKMVRIVMCVPNMRFWHIWIWGFLPSGMKHSVAWRGSHQCFRITCYVSHHGKSWSWRQHVQLNFGTPVPGYTASRLNICLCWSLKSHVYVSGWT